MNRYLVKIADDNGYFEPAAVGVVAGGLTGALAGGSLGFAGGEMALDSQRQVNEISNKINNYFKKVPLVTLPEIQTTNPSRGMSLLKGIGKGLKYGAMAGAPLGASLFVYDQYKRNQHEKQAMNKYLEKVAVDWQDTGTASAVGGVAGLGAALPTGALLGGLTYDLDTIPREMRSISSEGKAFLGHVGKGVKNVAKYSVPLGALYFGAKTALKGTPTSTPAMDKVAMSYSDTAVEDLKTGAKAGLLLGSVVPAVFGRGIPSVIAKGAKGMALGAGAGLAASIPHHLMRDKTQPSIKSAPILRPIYEHTVEGGKTGLVTGAGIGAGLGALGGGIGSALLYSRFKKGLPPRMYTLKDGTQAAAEVTSLGQVAKDVLKGATVGAVPGGLMGLSYGVGMGAPLGAATSLANDYNNRYLQKAAEDWSPDSYARRLGYANPKSEAIKAGLTSSMLYPVSSEQNASQNIGSLAATGLSAHQAHEEAVMKNQIIQELLQAQEHGIKTGDMTIFESLRDEFLNDVPSDRLAGRILGGISGAALGGMLGHAVGNSGAALATGALVGTGLGALGLGYAAGKGAEKENRQTNKLLDSRHSHLAALLSKTAEEIEHDYKPALAAGGIDAAMGLGLGALGQQISKRYLGGKYAPLVIGGLEGTAAMAATDIYQRKHEAEMRALQERLQG